MALVILQFVVQPLDSNDFDSRPALPLGRLGAARPPAAGEGIPEGASPRGRFEELFYTLSRIHWRTLDGTPLLRIGSYAFDEPN